MTQHSQAQVKHYKYSVISTSGTVLNQTVQAVCYKWVYPDKNLSMKT